MTAALLAVALAAPPAASAATATARLVACASALEPEDRLAAFEGRMRAVRGAARLQMRFSLQTRGKDDARWRSLPAPGFGRWLTSLSGVGRYVYTKRVVALAAPGSYRTVVRFRWLAADGRRLASDRATSPACRQADLRPNLRPLGIEALPGADPGHASYAVPVENRSHSDTGPFDVVVSVDGTTLPAAEVPALEAGQRVIVEIDGPACSPGAMLTVDVDPTGAVDERAEADNRLSLACPGKRAPGS